MCERNIDQLPLTHPHLGAWPTAQPCADWESNLRPFWSAGGAHSTQPHQPGCILLLLRPFSGLHKHYWPCEVEPQFHMSRLARRLLHVTRVPRDGARPPETYIFDH